MSTQHREPFFLIQVESPLLPGMMSDFRLYPGHFGFYVCQERVILETPTGTKQCPCHTPQGKLFSDLSPVYSRVSQGQTCQPSHESFKAGRSQDKNNLFFPSIDVKYHLKSKTLNSPKLLKFETHTPQRKAACFLFPHLHPTKGKTRSLPGLLLRAIFYDKASCHCSHEVIWARAC